MKKAEATSPQDYQVLARRFRPQQFGEMLGQEALVTTLIHSVRLGRVGHAYLFSGPRGVGKTTVARILAKAINCNKGPTETPCDQCQNCLDITQGNALDVLEIDGASNRGIDEIRNLRENVKYMAATSRYKIYIIDEVHMLTQEAFNALLKTLEEPPPHVKFFFATTDPQKIPTTILSRCQKFELRRIPSGLMAQRLNALAQKEKVQLHPDATLAIIAQAQGSMRDAESLLEVLIASGPSEIGFACVQDILGLSDQEIFFRTTDAVFGADAQAVLQLVADLFYQGREPGRFLAGFTGHLRNLLMAKALGEKTDVLEMPSEQIKRLAAQAQGLDQEHLIALADMATRTEGQMRGTANPRILLELFFMKAVECIARPALSGLLRRLEQLETRLCAGTGASAISARPSALATPTAATKPPSPTQMSLVDEPPWQGASDIKIAWDQIAQTLGSTHPIIRTCMQDARPIAWNQDALLVQIKQGANFQKATLEDKSCQDLIEQRLKERFGRTVRIQVDFVGEKHAQPAVTDIKKEISEDPALLEAMSILKGKIIRTIKSE